MRERKEKINWFRVKDFFGEQSVRLLPIDEKGAFYEILYYSCLSGGKMWKNKSGDPMSLNDLAWLFRIEVDQCEEILNSLIAAGCLSIDEKGSYYNEKLFSFISKKKERAQQRKERAAARRAIAKTSHDAQTSEPKRGRKKRAKTD